MFLVMCKRVAQSGNGIITAEKDLGKINGYDIFAVNYYQFFKCPLVMHNLFYTLTIKYILCGKICFNKKNPL